MTSSIIVVPVPRENNGLAFVSFRSLDSTMTWCDAGAVGGKWIPSSLDTHRRQEDNVTLTPGGDLKIRGIPGFFLFSPPFT